MLRNVTGSFPVNEEGNEFLQTREKENGKGIDKRAWDVFQLGMIKRNCWKLAC